MYGQVVVQKIKKVRSHATPAVMEGVALQDRQDYLASRQESCTTTSHTGLAAALYPAEMQGNVRHQALVLRSPTTVVADKHPLVSLLLQDVQPPA